MTTKNNCCTERYNSNSTAKDQRFDNLNLNLKCSSETREKLVSSDKINKKEDELPTIKHKDHPDAIFYGSSYSCGRSWNSDERDAFKELKTAQSHVTVCDKHNKINAECRSCCLTTNSTLSLHIAAYEAALELVYPNPPPNKAEEARLRLKLKVINKVENERNFEFPRQQENEDLKQPEVTQFRASQKLLNPNIFTPTGKRKEVNDNAYDILPTTSTSSSSSAPTPSPSTAKKRFLAPSKPILMTPQELESYQYDEPDLREWQKEYLTPKPQPQQETLEEEVARLRSENSTLLAANSTLKSENTELKSDLHKLKSASASKEYRDRQKTLRNESIPHRVMFETFKPQSQINVINCILKDLTGKYGEDNAKNIINAMYERQMYQQKTSLTPLQTLQLLKSSGITITALREIRSTFNKFGVHNPFASDASVNAQRAILHESVKMVKKTVMMDGKNGEKVPTNVFCIKSVKDELTERVKTLIKAQNYEPWYHEGVEEIPCVFSGDKGKDFTTVVMGVGSTKNPRNSPHNCSKLGYYKGNDSQSNMYEAFGDPGGLADQIDQIKEIEVDIDGIMRKFKIRWFVLGDFKFLNAIAGLNTNSAKFPCWGCVQKQETTYGELDINNLSAERVMGVVDKELSQIRPPLFKSIPFDHYIPPILHITLGPAAQLFEAICERARELDVAELNEINVEQMLPNEKVKKSWSTIKKNIESLKDEVEEIQYKMSLYEIPPGEEKTVCDSSRCFAYESAIEINNIFNNDNFCTVCSSYFHKCCLNNGNCPNCAQQPPKPKDSQNLIDKQLKELEKELKQTSKILKDEEQKADDIISKYKLGRLAANVEKVFEKFGGSRKAFFQEFTGKQLNKMGSNVHAIYYALDEKLKSDVKVQNIVRAIIQFFNIKKLLTTYVLSDEEVNEIEESIQEFGAYMKQNLPEMRVKQKGHSFFKHLPKYVKKFHIAAFFIDECIESFHVVNNKYMRRIGNRSEEECALLLFKYNKEDTWLHDTFYTR